MPPQMRAAVKAKKSALLALLRCGMPDFTLQLKWELASGMPGVSGLLRRYAPHDTYSLWKKVGRGGGLRYRAGRDCMLACTCCGRKWAEAGGCGVAAIP